jgi:AraC-like DNA-binding protein
MRLDAQPVTVRISVASVQLSDLLSSVLRLVRASSGLTGRLRAGGDWALEFPSPASPKFNALVEGSCWLIARTEAAPIRLDAGDTFLLVAPQPYVLASDPSVPAVPAGPAFGNAVGGTATAGTGADALVIGGQLSLDRISAPFLLRQLPSIVLVRARDKGAEELRWALIHLVAEETSGEPGSALIADHLAEMIVVLLLRACHGSGSPMPPGWLPALEDVKIAAALNAIQARPAGDWTVQGLAAEAGMSRSSFSERFTRLVGSGPMTFLAEWRLVSAAAMLREDVSLSAIADKVGYGSESSLGAAFRRRFGTSPARFRREAQASNAESVDRRTA